MARKKKKQQKGSGKIALLLALVLIASALLYRGWKNERLHLPENSGSIIGIVEELLEQFGVRERFGALFEEGARLFGELFAKESHGEQTDSVEESVITLETLPEYHGIPFVELEGNLPAFTEEELTTTGYEAYSPLDLLGRCGEARACVGLELMPTEERGSIGMIKPSGWQTVRYDDRIDGKYLYNRCHLIGYQLTGENANEMNLITGTRYLNVEGMLPFENEIADYVQETGNHVLYRVTPIFRGVELVARGVQMEAYSVEDGGEGVSFHVYCYNVQPGVGINYLTGDSWAEEGYIP